MAARFAKTFGGWGPGAPRKVHESAFKLAHRLNKKPWVCDLCGTGRGGDPSADMQCPNPKCLSNVARAVHPSWHRRRNFVNSMADIFDPEVAVETLARTLDTIRLCPDMDFLLVTKRAELWYSRCVEVLEYEAKAPIEQVEDCDPETDLGEWVNNWTGGTPPKNIWLITTAETQPMWEKRRKDLLAVPAIVHGVSVEPLLEDIRLDLTKPVPLVDAEYGDQHEYAERKVIDWVIVGGESGKNARPCNVEWIRSIKDQCKAAGVACFVKQLGSKPFIAGQRAYDMPDGDQYVHKWPIKHPKGGDINEWPEDMRVQQWPEGGAR
jgi:protein gp37